MSELHPPALLEQLNDEMLLPNLVASCTEVVVVKDVAGAGRSLFAKAKISAGQLIIAERACCWQQGLDENGAVISPDLDNDTLHGMLLQFAPFSLTKANAGAAKAVTVRDVIKEVFASNSLGFGPVHEQSATVGYAQGSDGRALFPGIAMTNHSCMPNCRVFQVPPESLPPVTESEGQERELAVQAPVYAMEAIRDIAEGEEVTISYVPVTLKKGARMSRLYANYLFACRCPRCEPVHDDTIVTRCPHCTQGEGGQPGRVYWKRQVCEDCGKGVDVAGTAAEGADEEGLLEALTAPGRPSELIHRLMNHPFLAPEDVRIFLTAMDLLQLLAPSPSLQTKLGILTLAAAKRMPFISIELYGLDAFAE